MSGLLGKVAALGLAAAAWAVLATMLYDVATVTAASAAVALPNDPCRVADPLGQGFERHCDLRLRLVAGVNPIAVSLDETWEANALSQRLSIGERPALFGVATRTVSAAGATRFSQLRVVPAGERIDHLAYAVGNCGGVICGQHDVVVVGAVAGGVGELLHVRLGRAGSFEVRAGSLQLVEPYVPSGATAPTELQVRTYAWDGSRYVQRGVELRPTPTPSPSVTPR